MSGYAVRHTAAGTLLFLPSPRRPGRVPVVLAHGAGASGTAWADGGTEGASRLAAGLAARGIAAVATDLGGPLTYGAPSVVAPGGPVDAALALLRAARPDLHPTRCAFVGGSMGGYVSLRYAATRPAEVAAVAGVIPLVDVARFYATQSGYAAGVAAAWGVANGAALPAASDLFAPPALGAVARVPVRCYYSTVDTVVDPTRQVDYVAELCRYGGHATAVAVDSTYGHDDRTTRAVSVDDLAVWLMRRGA